MAQGDSGKGGATAARRAAVEARAKQRATARKRTIVAAVSAVAVGALFVGAVVVIMNAGKLPGHEVYDSGVLRVPSAADASGGILVSAGGVAGGEAPEGAVRIDTFEDPLCPGCRQLVESTTDELAALVESGAVALYVHPLSFLDRYSAGTHYSTRAVNAIATVAEYHPERFMAFIKAIFANQPVEGGPGLTNDEIAEVARRAGVSEAAILKIADGEFTQWAARVSDDTVASGVMETPTVLIAGVREEFWLFPGVLTFDVAVVAQAGSDTLAAINDERSRVGYEEGSDALTALLAEQVASLTAEPSPSPSPSASS